MVYEIRARKYMGIGTSSIGYFYYSKEKAEDKCQELNKLMDVYFVSPIEMQDESINKDDK